MSFLAPWMLYGLAALAAPLLIHLLHRQRMIPMPFSTLRFLKAVAARTSRRSRLENVLLLLLRCAIVVLLVMAIAQPAVSPKAASFLGGDVPRTIVLIVDNSLSMAYQVGKQTRLDLAKEQAQVILDSLKAGDEVAVIAVSDQARLLIAEPTIDHATARKALRDIPQTEAGTDFSAALLEARKLLARSKPGPRQVYLLTDNQALGWAFDSHSVFDDAWKERQARLTVARTDDLVSVNASVKEVHLKAPPWVTPGGMVRGAAVVANFSSAPHSDVLEIEMDGERMSQSSVEAAAHSTLEVPFEFQAPATTRRFLECIAKLQGDNLPGDDRYFFVLGARQSPHILVVERQQVGPEPLHSGFFLKKALGVSGSSGSMAVIQKAVSTAGLNETSLEEFAAIFLADAGSLDDRSVARLNHYLEDGGMVIFLPGDHCAPGNLTQMDFLPAKPVRLRELPPGRLSTQLLEPTHPLLAGAWDANTPFPPLPQQRLLEWQMGRDARALINVGNDLPFLITSPHGAGQVLIINASPDRAWGDFPLSPAFLPLVQQIVRWSAEGGAAMPDHRVGDPIPLPPKLPRDRVLTITGPHEKVSNRPAGETGPLEERAEQSGFYKVALPEGEVVHEFAVNVNPRESDLLPMEPSVLNRRIPSEVVVGQEELKLSLGRNLGLVPLWPFLLVLAFLAFAAEGVLANLLARNRSQAAETHIPTGRLNRHRMGVPFHPETQETRD